MARGSEQHPKRSARPASWRCAPIRHSSRNKKRGASRPTGRRGLRSSLALRVALDRSPGTSFVRGVLALGRSLAVQAILGRRPLSRRSDGQRGTPPEGRKRSRGQSIGTERVSPEAGELAGRAVGFLGSTLSLLAAGAEGDRWSIGVPTTTTSSGWYRPPGPTRQTLTMTSRPNRWDRPLGAACRPGRRPPFWRSRRRHVTVATGTATDATGDR